MNILYDENMQLEKINPESVAVKYEYKFKSILPDSIKTICTGKSR